VRLPRWLLLFSLVVGAGLHAPAFAQGDAKKGEYLSKAAGCIGCHTAEGAGTARFAGGRPLLTPFGTFYGPNITPDRETGIGAWSEADFQRAIRLGERPDGGHYFPAFPYPAFTRMSDSDIRDLWAYLRSIAPVRNAVPSHALRFPFGFRPLVAVWKRLFFTPGPFAADPKLSPAVNRGSYLANALAHCSECHTPRNFMGGLKSDRLYAGGEVADGKTPNLTPTRLKKWNDAELREFLKTGATPEGDAPSDTMYEVIRNTTSQLTPEDLAALVAYLRALPPQPEEKK
jgi:mono/diheme cytochrome c family protein